MADVGDVQQSESHFPYIVIGGGIAGVTCAETVSYISIFLKENVFI